MIGSRPVELHPVMFELPDGVVHRSFRDSTQYSPNEYWIPCLGWVEPPFNVVENAAITCIRCAAAVVRSIPRLSRD